MSLSLLSLFLSLSLALILFFCMIHCWSEDLLNYKSNFTFNDSDSEKQKL